MLCVHIGPGRLGLGLVVEQALLASFDICLIGRPDGHENRRYGLGFTDPEVGFSYRRVRWAANPASLDDLDDMVLAVLGSGEPVLITCALDTKIAQRAELVAQIITKRPAGAETVLLACENDAAEEYAELAQRYAERLLMPAVVVDRICAWAEPNRDEFGRRMVQAHTVGEWIVERPATAARTLDQLNRAPLVRLVDTPIEGWKARKLWSVNGVHLVLGIVARVAGADHLPLAGALLSRFISQARPLCDQIAAGVHHRWPDVPCEDAYARERIRAFCESPDTTHRLLAKHLQRHDLRSFMTRLDGRLGGAARAAWLAGQDCSPFAEVMSLVGSALNDPRVFYEPKEPHVLDAAIDEEVLAVWEKVLTGWMDEGAIAARVSELRRTLDAQRDMAAQEYE